MDQKFFPGEVLINPSYVLILDDSQRTIVARKGGYWYRVDGDMIVQTAEQHDPIEATKAPLLSEGPEGEETTVQSSEEALTDTVHGGVKVRNMVDHEIVGTIEICQHGASWHRVPDKNVDVARTVKYDDAIDAIIRGGRHKPK